MDVFRRESKGVQGKRSSPEIKRAGDGEDILDELPYGYFHPAPMDIFILLLHLLCRWNELTHKQLRENKFSGKETCSFPPYFLFLINR